MCVKMFYILLTDQFFLVYPNFKRAYTNFLFSDLVFADNLRDYAVFTGLCHDVPSF
jgi:hypothetical protein